MTTARTDIHRPSSPDFDPEAYDVVDVFDLRARERDEHRRETVNELLDQGYRFAGSTAGECGHCGAHLRYAALLTHANGRDMMYVGETCLSNRFTDMTAERFQELRKTAALNQVRARRVEWIADLVDTHPLLAELTYPQINAWSSDFLVSVGDRLRRAGDLSDRQIDAAEAAILREIDQRERDEKREAIPPASPIPDFAGRVEIEGTVLHLEWRDNDFGGSLKTLLRHDDGWKLWGTVPASISCDIDKGDRIRFTAMVQTSGDDPTFGFFSRPTRATIL